MTYFRAAAAALIAIAPISAVYAHHGWSSYDETKPVTLTGALYAVDWGNPHGTARMTWQGRRWDVVLAPVSRMEARGLSQDMIAKRQRVTITGYVRKDGTPEMRLERLRIGERTVEFR